MWRISSISSLEGRLVRGARGRFLIRGRASLESCTPAANERLVQLRRRKRIRGFSTEASTFPANDDSADPAPSKSSVHKQALKALVNSLLASKPPVVPTITREQLYNQHQEQTKRGSEAVEKSASKDPVATTDANPQHALNEASTASDAFKSPVAASSLPRRWQRYSVNHPSISRLAWYLKVRDTAKAVSAFYDLVQDVKRATAAKTVPPEVPIGLIKALYRAVCPKQPFDVYRVLMFYSTLTKTNEYRKNDGDINGYANMYERACYSLRFFDPERHSLQDCRALVRSLLADVKRLDRNGQETCIPVLISALLVQRSNVIGLEYCPILYQYMVEQDLAVPPGYWTHLLSHSRYNRQGDIPFEEILEQTVRVGTLPHPTVVLNALDNFFPYTDTIKTSRALQAVFHLQQKVVENQRPSSEQYYVDIQTLEQIGSTAASKGQSDILLLIWDMMDLLGYEPSEAIYENTIIGFARNPFTYREAFVALADMEEAGFEPTRALIRSMSTYMRETTKNLDFAMEQVKQLQYEGHKPTTPVLNAIMSGAAERGEIDRILSLIQEFERSDVHPNADTYSFAFESLGKNLRRGRNRNPVTQDHKNACVIAAESFLTRMEKNNIAPTHHIIRDYVEVLCLVGQVDTATAILKEAVDEEGLVSSKTIYRVALANAKIQKFDVAREVGTWGKGPVPFLMSNIEREEKLYKGIHGEKVEEAETLNSFSFWRSHGEQKES